ncbi:MAG: hypothetical protein JSS76_09665 [Bacteroidetes bacterium]|nr:hypothetical protein [Bacteroidota bacterium]
MRCDDILMSNKDTVATASHRMFFLQTDTIVFRALDDGATDRAQILKLEKSFLRWVILLDEGGRGAIMEFRKIASDR